MRKNLLAIKEAEEMVEKYKEEIAHEFGIYHSVSELDWTKSMTKKLLNKANKRKEEC